MYRTPPRRSPRLNKLSPATTSNNIMDNNFTFLTTVDEEQMGVNDNDRSSTAAAATHSTTISAHNVSVPAKDSSAIGIASSTLHSDSNNQTTILLAMEKRLAQLEVHLSDTQVQLRERNLENDALRAALHSNGSSAVTYASSMVAQSTPAPAQPQPTQTALHEAVQSQTNSNNGQPFAEIRQISPNQPIIFGKAATSTNVNSAFHTNRTFSSLPSQPSNFSIPFNANSGCTNYYPHQYTFMPRKLLELPDFSGQPEDWPVFYTAFNESTAAYGYSDFDNNQRLQKCLKGEARETVKALLIHPKNVPCIIEQLKFR